MGVADRVPKHGHALGWRDDGTDFPDPGPDHFAVAVLGSLLSLPSTRPAMLPQCIGDFRTEAEAREGIGAKSAEWPLGHCTVIGLATRGIMMIESCRLIVPTAK